MSPHAATGPDALAALLFMLTWAGDTSRLLVWDQEHGESLGGWHWNGDGPRLSHLVRELDVQMDVELSLSTPRPSAGFGTCARAGLLWAVADSPSRVQRLGWFKPQPTLILADGKRRLAVWCLERALSYEWVLRANRRIAYRIGATQRHGDPDSFEFWVPGSCRRRDRTRPVPVVVERLELVSFAARDLVGRLRDPPPADAWRSRGDVDAA